MIQGAGVADPSSIDHLLAQLQAGPQGQADPFPLYRQLHACAPIHRSERDGHWYAVRYEDCRRVLFDPRMERLPVNQQISDVEAESNHGAAWQRSVIIFEHPPEHGRVRNIIRGPFRPRQIEAIRARVVEVVDGVLDGLDGEIDVMEDLAVPVSVAVSGDVVGIDPEDRPELRALVTASVAALEGCATIETRVRAAAADAAIEEYFARLIERRRSDPKGDLLSHMVRLADTTDQLTADELMGNAIFLFPAGFPSTSGLIGNGLVSLLRHPDVLDRIRRTPELVRPAVEEMLRFDGPAHLRFRTAVEPLVVGGAHIRAGETVMLLIGAANRDPSRFAEPDRFDIDRQDNVPLTFGAGPHHCLGAPLARLQVQILFERFLARFPKIDFVDGQPPVHAGLLLRSPRSFRVTVGS